MTSFEARVHHEDGHYWAEVVELPGVFASGETLDELVEALGEAIGMYRDEPDGRIVDVKPADPAAPNAVSAEGLRIAVPA